MSIATRLRQGIDSLGLKNLKDVSERCGIPYRSLQNYLSGEREPNAEALTQISTHLGISVDWLLTGTGSQFRGDPDKTKANEWPLSTIGSRLRDERERLGISAAALASIGFGEGVGESLQQFLEEDLRVPTDTYLFNAAAVGIDVLLVLSGERSSPLEVGFERRLEALNECTRLSEKFPMDSPVLVEALYVSREHASRGVK
jgi:transcriptional regulator with XRE-family HTH domain